MWQDVLHLLVGSRLPEAREQRPCPEQDSKPVLGFLFPKSPTRLGRAEMPVQLRALYQTSLCPQQPVPEMDTGRGQLF